MKRNPSSLRPKSIAREKGDSWKNLPRKRPGSNSTNSLTISFSVSSCTFDPRPFCSSKRPCSSYRAGPILIDKARSRSNYSGSRETIVDGVFLTADEQIDQCHIYEHD